MKCVANHRIKHDDKVFEPGQECDFPADHLLIQCGAVSVLMSPVGGGAPVLVSQQTAPEPPPMGRNKEVDDEGGAVTEVGEGTEDVVPVTRTGKKNK